MAPTHGYIPIHIVKSGKAKRVIACDINKGPLEKAANNIAAEGLSNIIETRLGSGLGKLNPGETETAVISGMGGMLISEILNRDTELTRSFKQLVLCPHLDVPHVRKTLHNLGFCIEQEAMVKDCGKFYNILSAIPGNEQYDREIDYIFGKYNLKNKNQVLLEYLNRNLEKLEEMKVSLTAVGSDKSREKVHQLTMEIGLYKEALEEYEM